MKKLPLVIIIIITAVVAIGIAVLLHFVFIHRAHSSDDDISAIQSPYAGEETSDIKSLSPADIAGLRAGAGTPFGGMAKPAELNGYPGPLHVLEAVEAGQFEVTPQQKVAIEQLYQNMKAQAVVLGESIIAVEQQIDDDFVNQTVTDERLQQNIAQSAMLYGQLRLVHLSHHLQMVDILSPEQVARYNTLRGYGDAFDPCNNIPAGHDPKLWRAHNNCE